MPPAPIDPKDWKEYFIQVCSARLTLTLAKEEAQWDADFPPTYSFLRTSSIDKLSALGEILDNPGVPPRVRVLPFNRFTIIFREEISKLISEKLH